MYVNNIILAFCFVHKTSIHEDTIPLDSLIAGER